MGDAKPTVVVTGISGNLGTRLLPQLGEFNVIGLDVNPPVTDLPLQFERADHREGKVRDLVVVSERRS